MQVFYGEFSGDAGILKEEEARHAIKVLRKSVGDEIQVINGSGSLYACKIVGSSKHEVYLQVISKQENFGVVPYNLHLAIAPTKNIDRFEWMLEKATEMGVSAFYPFISRNSERRRIRQDRLERVVLSAAKQSLKGQVPVVHELQKFDEVIKQHFQGQKFIAHCSDLEKHSFTKSITTNVPVMIYIGPEGDFTDDEIARAIKADFKPVSLGNSRLRTETAGVVAVSVLYNLTA